MFVLALATRLYEVPQWGTATLPEVIWLFSGVLALFFCAAHLPSLVRDYRAARTVKSSGAGLNQPRVLRLVAWSYVRRELIRLVQAGIIAGFGIYGTVIPPAAPGPAVISILGIILTGLFLIINFSVALMSWWDFKTRSQVQTLLEGYSVRAAGKDS